jgi:hypothetical protein
MQFMIGGPPAETLPTGARNQAGHDAVRDRVRFIGRFASALIPLAFLSLPAPAQADVFRVTDGGSMVAEVPMSAPIPRAVVRRPVDEPVRLRRWVEPGDEQVSQQMANRPVQDLPDHLRPHFAAAADRYGLSESLLAAVAWTESRFRTDATSPAGALGVMQLMPGTARDVGVADRSDPSQNVMGGARYLRMMLDRFGNDLELALAGYNAGPGAVQRFGGIPPYRETRSYVRQVIARLADEAASEAR